MYVGHAGVALVIKSRSPRTAITLLTIAAFGPDWTELLLGLVIGRQNGEIYSHCLPGLALGAALAWCASALVFDREVAAPIAVAWLLHWPADFLTALKPLIDPHHLVGLDLYQRPRVDLAMEALLVIVGCVLYARAYAPAMRQRLWVTAAGFALVGLQGVLDFGIARENPVWAPKLASAERRPHVVCYRSDVRRKGGPWPTAFCTAPARMVLARSLRTFTASE